MNGQHPGYDVDARASFTCSRILVDFFYGDRVRVRHALAFCILFSDFRQPHLCQQGGALLAKRLVLRRGLNQL
jgi:hypothetical protein